MIQYSYTHDETACCGCRACEQICSASAIQMRANAEGFLYPIVNQDACIHCGMCSKVCPMENVPVGVVPEAAYAVMNRNHEILMNSSSGGVFRLLADYVISNGGYVVGCLFDEKDKAILTITNDQSICLKMQGSKYVSSDTRDIYLKVQSRLRDGQLVLFSGTPCQNAGLIRYLRQPYENLITLDFLCHGVPSQQVFDQYKAYLEKKYHGHISDFKFRDKTYRGWGLAESFSVNSRKHYRIGFTSTYIFGFISNYLNRYSCYGCPFKGMRFTDFTISDYWGIKNHHNIPGIEEGVSAVTVNTPKAMAVFKEIEDRMLYQETHIEWIAEENPSIINAHADIVPQLRKDIYQMIEHEGWDKIAKSYLRCPNYHLKRIWYRIPSGLAKRLKSYMRKG